MVENWTITYSRVGKGKPQTATFTHVVVTNIGPFSLWTVMLILSKGRMISDEEKQLHVGQLHVCPHSGGASIRRWLQTIWTGKYIW